MGKALSAVRRRKRVALYKRLALANGGVVACFVCGEHVRPDDATLEHKRPLSKGGDDRRCNLAISHRSCNMRRGNADPPVTKSAAVSMWARRWAKTKSNNDVRADDGGDV